MSGVQRIAVGWVVIVVGLFGVHLFLPQRSGPIALSEVFEPYLIVLAILALPLFVRLRTPWSTALATVLVVTTFIRYLPVLVSTPQPELGTSIRVAAWNMLAEPRFA